ncbi:MAG: GNAT family N-acetyltransferase [Alphaproteobacteria bacterium]|nr:GNAT family N-acetyltransferase [Alphaproteobacteria bacterium]MBO6627014.1 GNAT family N-acetyltransferase [Alphaproteobacteria bacterium]MDF1627960.1 GNAT family N-acetyltransferase [Parvibaculaceae bacterium]
MNMMPSKVDSKTSNPVLTVRCLNAHEWLALGTEWEELLDNALEENAYYARQYVQASLNHIESRKVKALTLWANGHLVALLPFVTERWRWLGLQRANIAWKTPYSTLTAPLIDQRFKETAIPALAEAMRNQKGAWLFPELTLDGAAHMHLSAEWNRVGTHRQVFDPFNRAIMLHGDDFEHHRRTVFSKKRRKELERVRKRLSDLGEITETHATGGPELDHAVEEFLRIEASGWKGDRGTALGSNKKTRAFAREAFGSQGDTSLARADLLLLNGTAIAAYLTLQTGATGFTIKCAFDEAYRSQGVGLILFENMIRNFLNGNWANKLDSAANSGHMIGALYNSTVAMGDLLVYGPEMLLPLALIASLETMRRQIRETAKAGWLRLRGR